MYRMRPVPMVFLRFAFSPQLSVMSQRKSMAYSLRRLHRAECRKNVHFRTLAAGYPHEAQVCFWMWSERRPLRGTPWSVHASSCLPLPPLVGMQSASHQTIWDHSTNHIVGTACASCCGACQSWKFPSLLNRNVSFVMLLQCVGAASAGSGCVAAVGRDVLILDQELKSD